MSDGLQQPPEGFIARVRKYCPEYEPAEPFSIYQGRCRFDWLRENRGITCDVPFVRGEICKTGNPENIDEETKCFIVKASKQRYWETRYKCDSCGRQLGRVQPNKCECGNTTFIKQMVMADTETQIKMDMARIKAREKVSAYRTLKHEPLRIWFRDHYKIGPVTNTEGKQEGR